MPDFTLIEVEHAGAVATVRLQRAEVHNAFNARMIGELMTCFEMLADDTTVRAVILTGTGRSFCAGADIQWMQASLDFTYDENIADADRLAAMYEAINTLPKPLIGRINGAAIGGGAGLVACCDVAIAVEHAVFGFGEVRLGILPAVIARYVVPTIGPSHARALFVTGARFSAARAAEIGLVHQVVAVDTLDTAVTEVVADVLRSGPAATGRAKALVEAMITLPPEERRAYSVRAIAEARMSPEGQAGLQAFLRKAPPPWSPE